MDGLIRGADAGPAGPRGVLCRAWGRAGGHGTGGDGAASKVQRALGHSGCSRTATARRGPRPRPAARAPFGALRSIPCRPRTDLPRPSGGDRTVVPRLEPGRGSALLAGRRLGPTTGPRPVLPVGRTAACCLASGQLSTPLEGERECAW